MTGGQPPRAPVPAPPRSPRRATTPAREDLAREGPPMFRDDDRSNRLRPAILTDLVGQYMTDSERAALLGLPPTTRIRERAKIVNPERLEIGEHCWIGEGAVLDASGGLSIGAHTSIGLNVLVFTHSGWPANMTLQNHSGSDLIERKPIRIGKGCFIGGNSVIMPGVVIGDFATVSPLSVVAKDVPDRCIVGGQPRTGDPAHRRRAHPGRGAPGPCGRAPHPESGITVANRIHPTAVVGDGVVLGDGNLVGPYSVILGPCRIGDGNWIGPHVSIGAPAEWRGGPHPAALGRGAGRRGRGDRRHGNRLREFVTVHQGTKRATRIDDECYLLVRSHVGHDVLLDNGVTLSCSAQLGSGHRGRRARQHRHGGGGPPAQPHRAGPWWAWGRRSAARWRRSSIAVGNPAREVGVNEVGLGRCGVAGPAAEAMAEYVKGHAPVPDGLPGEIAALLEAWERGQYSGRVTSRVPALPWHR
ncbi:DapH/DapD/GlmU-related protein [Yinghuangia aomiensis]